MTQHVHVFKSIDPKEALFAAIEGDNEIIIGAHGICDHPYELVIVSHGGDEPFEIVRESFASLRETFERLHLFLIDEYDL